MEKDKKLTMSKGLYLFLRLIVILVLIHNIALKNYENVFVCIMTLVLFVLPYIIERKFKIEIPDTLEIIILLFIFSAEILGEINSFYTKIPAWDTILHTINGFVMGAIGLSLAELLNNNKNIKVLLSPIMVAIFTFTFSMTIGVLWEFVEFGTDQLLNTDMQKDTIVTHINSVALDENKLNKVHSVEIESLEVNGEDWMELYGGYLDIGLMDTMKDLFQNLIGAIAFSIIGYFYSKYNKGKIVKKLLIYSVKDEPN
jgi:uncharacterized membrane protein